VIGHLRQQARWTTSARLYAGAIRLITNAAAPRPIWAGKVRSPVPQCAVKLGSLVRRSCLARFLGPWWMLCVCLIVNTGCATGPAGETLAHGRFREVHVYRPPAQVRRLAFLLSGDGGWSSMLGTVAARLAGGGTLVVGIDVASLFASLETDRAVCVPLDQEFVDLSRYIQTHYRLSGHLTPELIGHSAGATVAYVLIQEAPPGTFAGAVTLSFCVDLDLLKPLCRAGEFRYVKRAGGVRLLPGQLQAPWTDLHGLDDDVCPVPETREFASRIPGARLVELPGINHNYSRESRWWPQFEAAFQSLERR
jgi:pimeloyl-ACP methyl ester carboxylesterase